MKNSRVQLAEIGFFLNYVSYVSQDRRFEYRLREGFTDVIETSEAINKRYAIGFISLDQDQINAIALVKQSSQVTSLQVRIKIMKLSWISPGITKYQIDQNTLFPPISGLDNHWTSTKKRIEENEWYSIMSFIGQHRADVQEELEGMIALVDQLESKDDSEIRTQEVDAAALAIRLMGVDGFDLRISEAYGSKSGILGLLESRNKQVELREDDIIAFDQKRFGGWQNLKDYKVNSSIFSDGKRMVKIYNVNRGKAESKLGVDLIYQDLDRKIFILVQYKRLLPENNGRDWRYYPSSDHSIQKQLKTMDEFEASHAASDNGAATDYRYNADPFYFKFCPSVQSLNGQTLCNGMYITKNHVKRLIAEDRETKHISFQSTRSYFSNTLFIQLFQTGLIGCHEATADEIEKIIMQLIESGDSVVYGEGSKLS